MKEIVGNLWRYWRKPGYVICITTNGMVRKDGHLVMGRGNALEAMQRMPGIALALGSAVQRGGNKIYSFDKGRRGPRVLTFPTKHKFYEKSDLKLIRQSALRLCEIAKKHPNVKFILPRPGCGNGGLKWPTVKPVISMLPDNVSIISLQK